MSLERKSLALELGLDGVVRTGEAKKLINTVFLLAPIPSSLLSRLLSDLLQPRFLRLTAPTQLLLVLLPLNWPSP